MLVTVTCVPVVASALSRRRRDVVSVTTARIMEGLALISAQVSTCGHAASSSFEKMPGNSSRRHVAVKSSRFEAPPGSGGDVQPSSSVPSGSSESLALSWQTTFFAPVSTGSSFGALC